MSDEFVNEFTRELDKYNRCLCEYGGESYLLFGDGIIYLRVPGATRGNLIITKDNVIEKILLDPETCFSSGMGCFYDKEKEIKEIADKYIGYRLLKGDIDGE